MSYEFLRHVLQYATLINYIILIFWFLMLVFARPFLKRVHTQWFHLSDNRFDMINYAGIAIKRSNLAIMMGIRLKTSVYYGYSNSTSLLCGLQKTISFKSTCAK